MGNGHLLRAYKAGVIRGVGKQPFSSILRYFLYLDQQPDRITYFSGALILGKYGSGAWAWRFIFAFSLEPACSLQRAGKSFYLKRRLLIHHDHAVRGKVLHGVFAKPFALMIRDLIRQYHEAKRRPEYLAQHRTIFITAGHGRWRRSVIVSVLFMH